MKKILALILALAVILSLGACTGKTPDASEDPRSRLAVLLPMIPSSLRKKLS